MATRPYQLRLYFPHPDGVSRPRLDSTVLGPFATLTAAEDRAYEERILAQRRTPPWRPDGSSVQVVGYRIVNREAGGGIEADVLFGNPSAPAREASLTVPEVVTAIGIPRDRWARNCHGVSLAIVKSGVLGQPARVARGTCAGVGGQHSWVVLGDDCYDPKVKILDATLWSYDQTVPVLWWGTYRDGRHTPHGHGSIWKYGRPLPGDGPPIELTPSKPFSRPARAFLELLGPLDAAGWMRLANAPVGNWPAAEIIAAMADTSGTAGLIPIDTLGMVTDRNPGGLYLARQRKGGAER